MFSSSSSAWLEQSLRSTQPRSCRWRTRDTASSWRGFQRARRSRGCGRWQPTSTPCSRDVPGIKGWVTIGGYSALDSAKLSNVVTAFVMYQDWDQRPPGFSQTDILARAPENISLNSQRASCRAAALADPGLGQCFRLPDGRRRSRRSRPRRAAENGAASSRHRARPPGFFAHWFYYLQRQQSAALSRYRQNDGQIARCHDQRRLPDLADLFRVDLRQPVQQVQPELPGSRASRGRFIAASWRTSASFTSPISPIRWCRWAAC